MTYECHRPILHAEQSYLDKLLLFAHKVHQLSISLQMKKERAENATSNFPYT